MLQGEQNPKTNEIKQNTHALSVAMNLAVEADNIDSARNILMDILCDLNKLKRLKLEATPCVNGLVCGG